MRNFEKYAEAGKKELPRQQEMRFQEYLMLKHMADDDPRDGVYNAVIMAYNAVSRLGRDMGQSTRRGPRHEKMPRSGLTLPT